MIRSKLRQNILVVSALMVILGLIIDALFLIQIGEIKKQKEAAKLQERALISERQALDKLVETVQLKQPEMAQIDKTLPATLDEFVDFVNELAEVATASGVSLKLALDQNPKVEKSSALTYHSEGVTLELDGPYSDGINFLERIYGLPYYMQLDGITIKKNVHEKGVNMTGKMKLYLR